MSSEGARGLPKSLPEALRNVMRVFIDFLFQSDVKMETKMHPVGALFAFVSEVGNPIGKRSDPKSQKEPKAGKRRRWLR